MGQKGMTTPVSQQSLMHKKLRYRVSATLPEQWVQLFVPVENIVFSFDKEGFSGLSWFNCIRFQPHKNEFEKGELCNEF
jgi:hypothetical protein